MPRVTIDTSEATSFEVTEPGPYEMTVESLGDPVQGPNAKYIPVAFTFDDPNLAKKCGKVFRNYPIEGKGAGFFRDFWKATTGQDLPVGNAALDIDTDDAVSRHVIVQIGHEEYQGKVKNVPERITSAG